MVYLWGVSGPCVLSQQHKIHWILLSLHLMEKHLYHWVCRCGWGIWWSWGRTVWTRMLMSPPWNSRVLGRQILRGCRSGDQGRWDLVFYIWLVQHSHVWGGHSVCTIHKGTQWWSVCLLQIFSPDICKLGEWHEHCGSFQVLGWIRCPVMRFCLPGDC